MASVHEFFRRFTEKKAPDPRKEAAQKLKDSVREKLRDLTTGVVDHVEINLNPWQADNVMPAVEDALPMNIQILGVPDGDDFTILIRRGRSTTSFDLSNPNIFDDTTTVDITYPNPNARRDEFWDLHKSVRVTRPGMDKLGREIHALEFGNKVADALLQIREESPETFEYW